MSVDPYPSSALLDALSDEAVYSEGAFAVIALGFGEPVYGTAEYAKMGRLVTLHLPYLMGLSNSPSLILDGFPPEINTGDGAFIPVHAMNNGVWVVGAVLVGGVTWSVMPTGDPAVLWAPTGLKGLQASSFSYLLQ